MASSQSETVNSLPQAPEADSLFNIASDLETVVGKLECHAALLNELTEDTNLTYFALMYQIEFIRNDARGVFNRLHAKAIAQHGSAQP